MADPTSGRAGRNTGIWAADMAGKLFTAGQDALGLGKTDALNAIGQGRTQGLASLGAGYDAARPEYEGAIARFDPYAEAGRGALATYQGSLGLGGDAAHDSAVSAFQASPGYQWQQDQAADAIARKQSATGALGSGNTLAALSDRSQQIANQEYGGWQDRVNGLSNMGLQATGAQANLQKGLGDLGAQQGRDEASIYGTTGAQEAGLHTNFAQLGNQNIGNLSNTVVGAGTGAMMAGQTAAQNRLNLGMQGLSLGASLASGAMGLGGLGGSTLGRGAYALRNGTQFGAGGLY